MPDWSTPPLIHAFPLDMRLEVTFINTTHLRECYTNRISILLHTSTEVDVAPQWCRLNPGRPHFPSGHLFLERNIHTILIQWGARELCVFLFLTRRIIQYLIRWMERLPRELLMLIRPSSVCYTKQPLSFCQVWWTSLRPWVLGAFLHDDTMAMVQELAWVLIPRPCHTCSWTWFWTHEWQLFLKHATKRNWELP